MSVHLPRKRLLVNILIYAVSFAVLAQMLVWWVFLPVALIISIAHLYLRERSKQQTYRSIVESARSTQIESFPPMEETNRRDMDRLLMESFREVTSELERKSYQLVEKNIQLLSLKEISLTIISSLDEMRIVDSVKSFLSKGLGFKEVFVGIFVPEARVFHVYTFREAFGETSQTETTVELEELQGLLRKSVINGKPILIRDPAMHPIGNMNGQPVFEGSTMNSYLIVPMVKSTFSQQCWKSDDCILKSDAASRHEVDDLNRAICPSCRRLPVLGIIGVTDGFKAASLSQVDLVAVETLALQISTLLENSQLYDELKKEESFRQNVIDSMMNGLITVDNGGKIILVNESAERLTGFSAQELKGRNIDDVIVDNLVENPQGPVMQTLSGGRSLQKEVLLVTRDGARLPIKLSTSFLMDEEKRIQGALAVFFDITRIKKMEQKIMHLDKLAALGRFSSSMAHEIRNPLTGIVAGMQYLKRVGGIDEEHNENIEFILSEVNRIDRLISDILNVVRIRDLAYHPTQVDKIVRSSITSVSNLAKAKSVKIEAEFPDNIQPIMIDSDRITQVMINLLKNAVEASPEGGRIRVAISFPDRTKDVLFDEVRNFVIIEIEDQGKGFSDEDKNKIFEPFYTTKKNGTGLGLYVAHSIIERHGGYVLVESEKDKGAVFTVHLPVEKVEHGEASEIGETLER